MNSGGKLRMVAFEVDGPKTEDIRTTISSQPSGSNNSFARKNPKGYSQVSTTNSTTTLLGSNSSLMHCTEKVRAAHQLVKKSSRARSNPRLRVINGGWREFRALHEIVPCSALVHCTKTVRALHDLALALD